MNTTTETPGADDVRSLIDSNLAQRTAFAHANCLKRIAEARVNVLTADGHADCLAPGDLRAVKAHLDAAERELKLALCYLSNSEAL